MQTYESKELGEVAKNLSVAKTMMSVVTIENAFSTDMMPDRCVVTHSSHERMCRFPFFLQPRLLKMTENERSFSLFCRTDARTPPRLWLYYLNMLRKFVAPIRFDDAQGIRRNESIILIYMWRGRTGWSEHIWDSKNYLGFPI